MNCGSVETILEPLRTQFNSVSMGSVYAPPVVKLSVFQL